MPKARRLRAALAAIICSALLAAMAEAEAPQVQPIEVPAGDLITALETLSRQIGVSLIYQPEQMQGMTTDGVRGVLTVRDAVLQLVRGTALRMSTDTATGAILISSPAAQSFSISGASLTGVRPVLQLAQSATQVQYFADDAVKQVEEIVVTGSMLNSTAAAEEGAAPVQIISIDEIREGGATTVYEALRNLAELAGYADNDSRSGARDTREVNLRGLGAQYTIVLINGRRLGQNNLNLVPFAAVERIEVLKDGASAVYGSDALAGVVNVILRKGYDGVEFAADYGDSTHFADAGKANLSALLGVRGERGSFMASGQYEKQNAALSLEHPLGRSDDQRRFGSRDLRFQRQNPGLIRLAGGAQLMLDPTFGDGATGAAPADFIPAYDNRIDKQRINNLQNGREVGTFFGSGSYWMLDSTAELFADFLHKSANIDYVDHRGALLDVEVPAANYWNPFDQAVRVTYMLDATTPGHRERPLESLSSDMQTNMVTVGLRGVLGPVSYNLAHTDWRSSDLQSHDGLSRRGILAQLARSDSGALNLFGNAAVTAEQLEPARALFRRELTEFARSSTGVFTFKPFDLPAGPAAAAVGFELRNQGFDSQLDEALSSYADSISLAFLNDVSVKAERDVDAYFAEVNLPLAGGEHGVAGLRVLDVSLAARRESFSDFGDATVKRGTLRWQPLPSDTLTVRASYSESFYAPELRDVQVLGDSNFAPQTDPLILDANGQPIRYSMTNIAGGNPQLDPTLGKYKNVGVIFKPAFAPGLRITTDLWRLDQQDAFVYPTPQAVIDGAAPGSVIREPVASPGEPVGRIVTVINRVENAASRTVQGVDCNIVYHRDLGRMGRLAIESYNTFTTRFEYDQKDGRGRQNALGLVGRVFDIVPRFRSNLVLSQGVGPLNVSLATSYTGSVSNSFDNYRRIEPYVRSNLTLVYDLDANGAAGDGLLGNTQMWLNVQDLFDAGAPFVGVLRTQGITSDYTYVDYIGQFWTAGFRTRF